MARVKQTQQPTYSRDMAAMAFEQFSTGLHRYLLRRIRNAESAEDLEQEVYVRLLRISNAELVRCPQAYVYRIASNLLSQLVLEQRQGRVAFDSEAAARLAQQVGDESPLPDELYDQRRKEQRLALIVEQLPAMQKAVFVLVRYQGLSHAEVAAKLGLSVHTVKKHMQRAICHCRYALAEE